MIVIQLPVFVCHIGTGHGCMSNALPTLKTMLATMQACSSHEKCSLSVFALCSALAANWGQGCDTFTLSPDCARELFQEPLTMAAAADFEQSARALGAT